MDFKNQYLPLCACFALLLFAGTGCRSLNPGFSNSPNLKETELIGTVRVARWLSPTRNIPITEGSRDLYGAYSKGVRSAQDELLIRVLKRENSQNKNASIKITENDLGEDIIVLNRRKQFWYFQKELLAIPTVGAIKLMPQDTVSTLPFESLEVFQHGFKQNGDVRVVVSGGAALNPGEIILTNADHRAYRSLKGIASYLSDLSVGANSLSPSEIAVVTRIRADDGTLHHFLVPQDRLGKYRQDKFYEQGLKTGDIIQFSGLESYLSQF